jgi:hypothetical protein
VIGSAPEVEKGSAVWRGKAHWVSRPGWALGWPQRGSRRQRAFTRASSEPSRRTCRSWWRASGVRGDIVRPRVANEGRAANVDLPAHETVELEVPRDRSGAYARYCGKPFHPTMGMRGALELPWPFGRTPNLSTALRQERPVGGTLHSVWGSPSAGSNVVGSENDPTFATWREW